MDELCAFFLITLNRVLKHGLARMIPMQHIDERRLGLIQQRLQYIDVAVLGGNNNRSAVRPSASVLLKSTRLRP